MPSGVAPVEAQLIHACRCACDAPERATIIHRYAEITHHSMAGPRMRSTSGLTCWTLTGSRCSKPRSGG
jgi:hypothetical protein